jgi:hypothetical protein
MTILQNIVRGNDVEFLITFLDVDDVEITPASATVTVNYLSGGERVNEGIELETNSDGVWAGTWSSIAADVGRVFWSARSESPTSVQDGSFNLLANLANLGASV